MTDKAGGVCQRSLSREALNFLIRVIKKVLAISMYAVSRYNAIIQIHTR